MEPLAEAGGTRSDYLPGNCGYYAVADGPLPASTAAHTIITNS